MKTHRREIHRRNERMPHRREIAKKPRRRANGPMAPRARAAKVRRVNGATPRRRAILSTISDLRARVIDPAREARPTVSGRPTVRATAKIVARGKASNAALAAEARAIWKGARLVRPKARAAQSNRLVVAVLVRALVSALVRKVPVRKAHAAQWAPARAVRGVSPREWDKPIPKCTS